MNLWSLHSTPQYLPSVISCKSPKSQILKTNFTIPARDRIIDFGKFKGKILGTLPSTYLKWVSKNLRARDFEEWAKLADEVLDDPIYKDRIEWEFAQKVLNGDVLSSSSLLSRTQQGSVSELLEISERFGWDNKDKLGWAKIDFGLLGTSKGSRIPRLSSSGPRPNKDTGPSVQPELSESRFGERKEFGNFEEEKRRERRERLKLRRTNDLERRDTLGMQCNDKGSFGNSSEIALKGNKEVDGKNMEIKSPFPGREGLLNKVLQNRRYRSG